MRCVHRQRGNPAALASIVCEVTMCTKEVRSCPFKHIAKALLDPLKISAGTLPGSLCLEFALRRIIYQVRKLVKNVDLPIF